MILPLGFDRWRATAGLRVARHWLEQGEYELAHRWARRSVTAAGRRAALCELAVDALTVFAGAAQALGAYARAETAARRALELLDNAGEPRTVPLAGLPPRLAVTVRLADVLRLDGRYSEAERLLDDAASVAAATGHPLVIAHLHNVWGIVCKDLGRFDDADRHYSQALTAAESMPLPDEPILAALWHNMAGLAHARGRYRQGEPAARRAVEQRERRHGAEHPDVARDLTVLAAILVGQGRLDDAEHYYRRALDVFRRRLGDEHHEVGVVLSGLGVLAQERRDPVEAERLQRQALAIKVRVLGPTHPDVATALNNLALSLDSQDRTEQAASTYRQVLSILEDRLPPDHPLTLICRANYQVATSRSKR